jgi:hypothetical protein
MALKASDRMVEVVPGLDGWAETIQNALKPVLGSEGPKELQDLRMPLTCARSMGRSPCAPANRSPQRETSAV